VRELTVDEFVSLDGFAADASGYPEFALGSEGPEFARWEQQVLDEPQVIVLGRTTYQDMARYFPSAGGPIAAAMNAHPKLVFSRTLKEPLSWNNARLTARDPAAEITALKQQAGAPLRCIGSITLARQMMALGLVDRLRLVVLPRILGRDGQEPLLSGYRDTHLRPG
jgi:dihydrofolate reductase